MCVFFFSVTQRANHARDYLLGEALEKIDGYGLSLILLQELSQNSKTMLKKILNV